MFKHVEEPREYSSIQVSKEIHKVIKSLIIFKRTLNDHSKFYVESVESYFEFRVVQKDIKLLTFLLFSYFKIKERKI